MTKRLNIIYIFLQVSTYIYNQHLNKEDISFLLLRIFPISGWTKICSYIDPIITKGFLFQYIFKTFFFIIDFYFSALMVTFNTLFFQKI